MLTPTHLLVAQTSYLGVCIATGHQPNLVESAVALSAALVPDLDKRQSIIGRMFPFVSGPLEYWFGHRTLTHSLLAQTALLTGAYVVLPFGFFLAMAAGWLGHSVSDMMTPSGVAWFWPSRVRCVLPGNPRYRIEPMSWAELWVAFIFGALGVVFLFLSTVEQGTAGLIRSVIGSIASARQQYDAEKGSNAWTLRLEGRDNRTQEDIAGEYPVIGPWSESGFLLRAERGLITVCRSSVCAWFADHAVLVKGAPQSVTAREIRVGHVSNTALRESLSPLDKVGEVYLLGSVSAKRAVAKPPEVQVSGENIQLYYAGLEVLNQLPRLLKNVELIVQVRHSNDAVVPVIDLSQSSTRKISPRLRPWIQ